MRRTCDYGQRILARIPEELRDVPVPGMCEGLTPAEFAVLFDRNEVELQPQCPSCVWLFKDLAVWQPSEVWGKP